jgi:uncharacterized membrane protein YedE/YeeE
MEKLPVTSSSCWRITTSIIADLLFISFTFFAFFYNKKHHWKRGFIFAISGFFGFALQAAPFGFTCTFRSGLSGNFHDSIHMSLVLLIATALVTVVNAYRPSAPLFDVYHDFKLNTSPVGVSLALGSFMFGMGMQLGSGCASGTLVGVGAGFLKGILVLIFFIFGATLATIDSIYSGVAKLPKVDRVTIPWYATVVILALLFLLFLIIELVRARKAAERPSDDFALQEVQMLMTVGTAPREEPGARLRQWRLYIWDVALALVFGAWYLCEGRPIGIMGPYSVIGGRVVEACGGHPENWKYWRDRLGLPNLMRTDIFVSDVFIILGAFIAASHWGKFGASQDTSFTSFGRGIVGGVLMGLGGRMADGCNIGAMVSGITSSSVAGFVWLVCGVLGSAVIVVADKLIKEHCRAHDLYEEVH